MNYMYDCLNLADQDDNDISTTKSNNHMVIVLQTNYEYSCLD